LFLKYYCIGASMVHPPQQFLQNSQPFTQYSVSGQAAYAAAPQGSTYTPSYSAPMAPHPATQYMRKYTAAIILVS
jgi:hypothetical protein